MENYTINLSLDENVFMRMAGIAGWRLKADLNFDWTPSMYVLFDLVPTCSWDDVISRYHPEDRNEVTRDIAAAFSTGAALTVRYRLLRPDGSVRYVLSRAVRRFTPDGPELVGISIDVTLQMAEIDIDFGEMRRFKFIAENACDLTIRYGLDGSITYASPAALKTLGLKASEVVCYSVLDLVAEDDKVGLLCHLAELNQLDESLGPIALAASVGDGLALRLEHNPGPAGSDLARRIVWVD